MSTIIIFPYGWAMLFALYGGIEHKNFAQLVEKSQQVALGVSERDVLSILGEPDHRRDDRGVAAFLVGRRSRQWSYGTLVDFRRFVVAELPFPNPLPIKLRLFGRRDGDLVIEWSADNTVAKVARPDLGRVRL